MNVVGVVKNAGSTKMTLDVPSGAVFAQFTIEEYSSSTNIQIELGESKTQYVTPTVYNGNYAYYEKLLLDCFRKYTFSDGFEIFNYPTVKKNLYGGLSHHGYYIDSNGNVDTTSYNYSCSPEILLPSGLHILTISRNDGVAFESSAEYMFKDSNGTILSIGSLGNGISKTIIVPDNYYVFQFAYNGNDDVQIQIEAGSDATEYATFEKCSILEYVFNAFDDFSEGSLEMFITDTKGNLGFWNKQISDFELSTSAGYEYTDFIKVYAGDVVQTEVDYDNIYVTGIKFFNILQQPIEDNVPLGTGARKIAPENGYVVITYKPANITYIAKIYRKRALADISVSNAIVNKQKTVSRKFSDAAANSTKKLYQIPQTKNWYQISANFKIPNGMQRVRISRGTIAYSSGIVDVDDTNIYEYGYDGQFLQLTPHRLTMSDFVTIRVSVEGKFHKANLYIQTNSNTTFTKEIFWNGCYDLPAITNHGSSNITDLTLSFGGNSFDKDTWVFTDSYGDFWPEYAFAENCSNFMLDGQSGRTSLEALVSLRCALAFGIPKTICWFMGMNDPDTTSINENYATALRKVAEVCFEHNIKFRPATIPNCSERINSYKNARVKSTFFNYIDIADAVGASETGSSWYSGLLSGDNVHPTSQGARVISEYIAHCVPQIEND